MLEKLFRGLKFLLKGELLLWIILFALAGVVYIVMSLR